MFNSYNYVYCARVSFSCVVFFARKIVKIFQFGLKRNDKEGGDLDIEVSIIYMVNWLHEIVQLKTVNSSCMALWYTYL